jgi:hypothetical protein
LAVLWRIGNCPAAKWPVDQGNARTDVQRVSSDNADV